ncbi:Receptor-like protein kinase 2 [Vitis vinifera]|uniref:Receptor-like protein kinase 2 n=1 Tax=Vitis vinifera TaxID=29760 RepID=A0A438KCQ3_VITVI|nr:Receptor-like protein kinase 2 [Vitis vinifera]
MAYNQNNPVAVAVFFSLSFLALLSTSTFLCKNSTDCQSLLKFKQGITGDPDGHLQDWNETMFFCNWTGITCHQQLKNRPHWSYTIVSFESDKADRLELQVNYFTGRIPEELGALTKLEILYLHINFLEGSIPASISNCTALRHITLIENRLTGTIPFELGSKLHNLQRLYFQENQLSGKIPVTLSNLSQLTLLDLSLNQLEGKSLLKTALRGMSVCRKFTGFNWQSFQDLYYLNLRNNKLTGDLPAEIGNLSGLVTLDLWENSHPTHPMFSSNALDLSFNNLQGSLPTEIGHFSNLALSLNLSNNNLQGELPASIGNLASVQAIDLSANKFFGVIPSSIGRCISMEYLNLSHNMLEGTIPESLKQIIDLGYLDLAFNNLTGNVPIWIGDSQKIKNLNLSYNRLTGEVPNSGRSAGAETAILMCSPTHHGIQTLTERKSKLQLVVLQEECIQGYRSFKRECQILSEIRHRNLVRMIGSTWNSGFKAIVLEYIGNGNLEQHLYPGGSDEGVVHCDLKPQNVLWTMIWWLMWQILVLESSFQVTNQEDMLLPQLLFYEDLSGISLQDPFPNLFSNEKHLKRRMLALYGLDLRKWVCSAFPNQVLDIVDISLKHEAYLEEGSGALHKLEQCCIHMLDAGMMCTEENPQKRPLISSVAPKAKECLERNGIWNTLYGKGRKCGHVTELKIVNLHHSQSSKKKSSLFTTINDRVACVK